MLIFFKLFNNKTINLILLTLIISSCATQTVTNTKRSAREELILSTSVDDALYDCGMILDDKAKVFLDVSNLKLDDALEQSYLIGAIRSFIGSTGAIIVEKKEDSQIIFELYSGALATDYRTNLIGIPPMPVPVPFSAALLQTPKIALFEKDHQTASCKLLYNLVDTKSGEQIIFKDSVIGGSYYHSWSIMGFGWSNTDVFDDRRLSKHQLSTKFKKMIKDV